MAQAQDIKIRLEYSDEFTAQLRDLARQAKTETKRLGAQARRAAKSLAQLESACADLGIEFDNHTDHTDQGA